MALIAVSLLALGALAQQGAPSDVARLLEERCATCHSPDGDQPKAVKKWADASDLAATATNIELIVPGAPDESELYLVIDFGDMPPPGSESAPLTDEEKALLEAWIQGGATIPTALRSAEGAPEPADASDESNPVLRWLSHFHPLTVHFPLALLTAAFLAELLWRLRPTWKTDAAARFCLALGALSAVPSAVLGWMLAANLSHHGFELEAHRWLGSATAILAVFVWWGSARWPRRRLLLLLALAAIVGATGHTGGVLSYGADWLMPPF